MLLPRRASPLALLAIAALHLISAVEGLKKIEELFDISYDTGVGGHCGDYGSDRMNTMLNDAYELAISGVSMVTAANDVNNPLYGEAVRNLAAWFESPYLTAAQYDTVGNTYQAVSDWVNGQITTVDAGRSSLKPLLVCGDNSFTLRQSMNDQAWGFDATGKQVLLPKKDGTPFLIKDDQEYVNRQAGTSMVIKQQTYPHWCARMGMYIFDKIYGENSLPTDYLCAGPKGGTKPLGITKSWTPKPNTVTLCPGAFSNAGVGTSSVALTCIDASELVDTRPPNSNAAGITKITQIVPDGATLFHEIIHLVLGSKETTPNGGEEYVPSRMLGKVNRASTGAEMTSAEAFVNPQTYMYAASGFAYTLNAPLIDGKAPEFYTGYCSYQ